MKVALILLALMPSLAKAQSNFDYDQWRSTNALEDQARAAQDQARAAQDQARAAQDLASTASSVANQNRAAQQSSDDSMMLRQYALQLENQVLQLQQQLQAHGPRKNTPKPYETSRRSPLICGHF